jgi:hypothetical protein
MYGILKPYYTVQVQVVHFKGSEVAYFRVLDVYKSTRTLGL